MNKQKAFTIVELLTSIAIIAILIGLLLPSLAKIRRSAKEAAQKVQFAAIDMALDAFRQDYGDYPPSDQYEGINPPGRIYCGAQKLTEALLGWDLMGFDPNTAWRRDGYTGIGVPGWGGSYDPDRTRIRPADGQFETLFERKGPYLEVAKTPVFRLGESSAGAKDGLYSYNNSALTLLFDKTKANWVICDVFGVKKIKDAYGKIVNAGTPILYYKANTNFKTLVCPSDEGDAAKSIYNSFDNSPLLALRILPDEKTKHRLSPPPSNFCDLNYKIVDQKVPSWVVNSTTCYWPNRPDSYILISAGADHEFGTNDDILNF